MIIGLAMASGVPAAAADPGASHEKVYVCKYVGQPNVDERLQTGNNPIDVSTSAFQNFEGLGSYFADAHGQSYALAWAGEGVNKPPVTDCPAPRGPAPIVTSEDATSCTAYRIRAITTPFVLTNDKWVPGESVAGAWVTSTPTAEQLTAASLVCPLDEPAAEKPAVEEVVPPVSVLGVSATAKPKATKPASVPVSVLGVSATANPLPASAGAGKADTSSQLAAGELTGLAALLAFGAAFMLRRRRGVA